MKITCPLRGVLCVGSKGGGGEGAKEVELWVGEGGEEAWGREVERLREGRRVRTEVDLGESSYLCAGKRAPLYRNE